MQELALIWLAKTGKDAADSGSPLSQAPEALGEASESIQQHAEQLLPEDMPKAEVQGVSLVHAGMAVFVFLLAILLRWCVAWVIARIYNRALRPKHGAFVTPTAAASMEERKQAIERALRVASYAILLSGLFFSISLLNLPTAPANWEHIAWQGYTSLLVIFGGMLVYQLITLLLRLFTRDKPGLDSGIFDRQLAPLLRDLSKFAMVLLVVLLVAQTWAYDTTALLAGVGIGGIAIAFAAQDAIANVFGSLVIYSDRPYKVGDWVRIKETEGVVEEIGIRSTRIRLFDKSVVSVPNKSVAGELIHNFSAMTHRRMRMVLGLPYETDADGLEQALAAIRDVVAWHRGIESDTWVVHLTEFGASSQNILLLCFTRHTQWEEYLKIQEELLLEIRRRLDALGIRIAIPTQTVIYRAEGARGMDHGDTQPVEVSEQMPPPMQ